MYFWITIFFFFWNFLLLLKFQKNKKKKNIANVSIDWNVLLKLKSAKYVTYRIVSYRILGREEPIDNTESDYSDDEFALEDRDKNDALQFIN